MYFLTTFLVTADLDKVFQRLLLKENFILSKEKSLLLVFKTCKNQQFFKRVFKCFSGALLYFSDQLLMIGTRPTLSYVFLAEKNYGDIRFPKSGR